MPEIYMPADEARPELIPINPRIPYRGIPRHTTQRTLHGATSDVRHRRQQSQCGERSPRAGALTFVCVQKRRGEKDGPHVCVASIEALEPNVGDDIQRNAEERT